ncbi:MAG: AAA family ATPase [Pseudomonadota bacterium]
MMDGLRVTVGAEGARGLVRLSRRMLKKLELRPGDLVAIDGARRAYGRAVPGLVGPETMQLDAGFAKNAGVRADEKARLAPVDLAPLDTLVVRIQSPQPVAHADVKDALFDMAIGAGDTFALHLPAGGAVSVEVRALSPEPAGVLREGTTVSIEAPPDPGQGYEGVGGLAEQIASVHEMIAAPLLRPELYAHLGIAAPRGVLFYGPPGSGKTLLARAVANKTSAAFFHLNGPEIVTKHYGESEAALRKTFAAAEKSEPAIIFIDEIDAIAPARAELSSEKQVERRVVAQLLTLMDGLSDRGRVVVMAATNLPDGIDPALRRPGRFDREIVFRPPSAEGRAEILQVHFKNAPLGPDIDLGSIAAQSHGYVGADLAALAREAAVAALKRTVADAGGEQNVDTAALMIMQDDLEQGLQATGASVMRAASVDAAPVRWTDVGGLDAAKKTLLDAVAGPLKHRDTYARFRVEPPRGVLLCGPPGSGKTLLARALAHETGMNFIPVRPPKLLSQYFGAAERAVAELFNTARLSAPSLLFFDEFDAVVPKRAGKDPVLDRIVAQFLLELDGMAANTDLVVLAATNRPGAIDPALTRPGRFDLVIDIPLPDAPARAAVLALHLDGRPTAKEVDLQVLASRTEGLSGADLATLANDAARRALLRQLAQDPGADEHVTPADLDAALARLRAGNDLRQANFLEKERPHDIA